MKAEELMIGDWVIFKAETPKMCKVVSIDTDNGNYIRQSLTDTYYTEDCFEPIPLTSEILEKNGFVRNGTSYILTSLSEYWFCLMNNSSPHNYKDKYRLTISGMLYKIEFVHQLQHALRLCGINKEITL